MAQQPSRPPQGMPPLNLVWLIGLLAVALLAGVVGDRYFVPPPPVKPQTKVQYALEELRSGYDQTALALLKPLADEGNPKAQYWLADIYENGLGVKQDMATAITLLEKSLCRLLRSKRVCVAVWQGSPARAMGPRASTVMPCSCAP